MRYAHSELSYVYSIHQSHCNSAYLALSRLLPYGIVFFSSFYIRISRSNIQKLLNFYRSVSDHIISVEYPEFMIKLPFFKSFFFKFKTFEWIFLT